VPTISETYVALADPLSGNVLDAIAMVMQAWTSVGSIESVSHCWRKMGLLAGKPVGVGVSGMPAMASTGGAGAGAGAGATVLMSMKWLGHWQ